MTTELTERPDNPTAPDNLMRMMEIAISQGEAGVAALERIVALQERAQAIAAEQAHSSALAAFQADCPKIHKGARGAHGASYAPLDAIIDTIRAPLAMHGLAITFDSEETEDGRLKVWCIVHHAAGHSTRASFTVSREKASNRMNDTQRDGSALTYARRYALGLALNITTGEVDDDAQTLDGAGAEPVTEEQAANLRALIDETDTDLARFLEYGRVSHLEAWPARRYSEAVRLLERKRSQ